MKITGHVTPALSVADCDFYKKDNSTFVVVHSGGAALIPFCIFGRDTFTPSELRDMSCVSVEVKNNIKLSVTDGTDTMLVPIISADTIIDFLNGNLRLIRHLRAGRLYLEDCTLAMYALKHGCFDDANYGTPVLTPDYGHPTIVYRNDKRDKQCWDGQNGCEVLAEWLRCNKEQVLANGQDVIVYERLSA